MLYIGHFFHLTNQEEETETERRHGEFNLIVEADDYDTAVDMFRQRIIALRESRDFFNGECSIFFTQLLELDGFPKEYATIMNYRSFAGDPLMPFISCTVPNDQTDACRIYSFEEGRPEIDGKSEGIFLQFKASGS